MKKESKWTKEYYKQYQKEYRAKYQEKNREYLNQRSREYYYANRDRVRAVQAEYREANRIYFEIYRKANPHKHAEYNYNKRFTIET
jgi:hypothetical protein